MKAHVSPHRLLHPEDMGFRPTDRILRLSIKLFKNFGDFCLESFSFPQFRPICRIARIPGMRRQAGETADS